MYMAERMIKLHTNFYQEQQFLHSVAHATWLSCFYLTFPVHMFEFPRSNTFCGHRNVPSPPLSIKDKEEKTKRCAFVQGMLLSTILDDGL